MNDTLEISDPAAPWTHASCGSPSTIGSGLSASDDDGEACRVRDAATAILLQGEGFLATVDAASYAGSVSLAFNASLGGHYRHCLDHFVSFLRGLGGEEIDYDLRARDPRLESDPVFALTLTRQLRAQIEAMPPYLLKAGVRVRSAVGYGRGDSPATESTLGRELAYLIAHAIHHYALMSVMARMLGIELPATFGVAPSTLAYHRQANAPTTHPTHREAA